VQHSELPRESTTGVPLKSLAKLRVASSSRRSANGIFTLLSFYTAYIGSLLPTLRDNVSVPSSRVKHSDVSKQRIGPIFEGQTFRCFRTTHQSHLRESSIPTYRSHIRGSDIPTFRDNVLVPFRESSIRKYRSHIRGSSIPTFRDNVSVPSSRVRHPDVSGQRIGSIFESQAFRRFGTTYRSHIRESSNPD